MKQTAVEWLIHILKGQQDKPFNLEEWMIAMEHAKAMEKEQIIECWDNGFANGYDLGKYDDESNPDDAEQYYIETYESNT